MNRVLKKRFFAYIIDAFIVYALLAMLTSIPIFKKDLDKSTEISEKYYSALSEYSLLDEDDVEAREKYEVLLDNYSYKISKYSMSANVITYILFFMYHVVALYFCGGQTIGKHLFKIRIKSDNNKKVPFWSILVRSTLLYSFVTRALDISLLKLASKSTYLFMASKVAGVMMIIKLLIIGFMLFRKDGRGLHDILSRTTVELEEK